MEEIEANFLMSGTTFRGYVLDERAIRRELIPTRERDVVRNTVTFSYMTRKVALIGESD